MTKLPKKPKSHNNPRISRQQLENLFGNWNIYQIADSGSGFEYGQDYMVEVVNDESVTGKEFRVQSKVLTKKSSFRKNYIGESLAPATINYLLSLPVPVLIHFTDGRKSKGTGYVMWLEDWLKDNPKDEWQNKKKKKINIPLENVFNQEAVDSILKHVEEFYFIHNLCKEADFNNKHTKDHYIWIKPYQSNDPLVTISPRHSEANPIIHPLDENAKKSLTSAVESGLPTPIDGKISFSNAPLLISSNFEYEQAIFVPDTKKLSSIPIRIIFKNAKGEQIYKINYINLQPIQSGTKIRKWKGIVNDWLSWSFEMKNDIGGNSWHFDALEDKNKNYTLQSFIDYFDFCDKYRVTSQIEIEFLQTSKKSSLELFNNSMILEQSSFRQTINELNIISKAYNSEIDVPTEISLAEVQHIHEIARIVSSGWIDYIIFDEFSVNGVASTKIPFDGAIEAINSIKGSEGLILPVPDEVRTRIFNIELNLGSCQLALSEPIIVNEDEVYSELEQERDEIKVDFKFNKEKSFTKFPKWIPSNDEQSDEV